MYLNSKKSMIKLIKFVLIILCFLCVVGIITIPVIALNSHDYIEILNNEKLLSIVSLLIYFTSVPAFILLFEFARLFSNLEKNEIFSKENTKYFKISSICAYIIGLLYILSFIFSIIIFFNNNEILIYGILDFFILIISIIFLTIGLGLNFLKEIYIIAVENKEENELTI